MSYLYKKKSCYSDEGGRGQIFSWWIHDVDGCHFHTEKHSDNHEMCDFHVYGQTRGHSWKKLHIKMLKCATY